VLTNAKHDGRDEEGMYVYVVEELMEWEEPTWGSVNERCLCRFL
jgi:hypothetical protein